MKKKLLLLVLMLLPMIAMADTVEIDGIYYVLTEEGNAEVTSNPNRYYTDDIVIPKAIVYDGNTYSVTSIRVFAFRNCCDMKSISIPNSVTSIGAHAFLGCSGLTTVKLDCKVVGSWFSGMKSIKEVIFGEGVTSLDMNAFANCAGLTSVTIGDNITSIADFAFEECYNLASVTIGSGITSIGDNAFLDCNNLTSVTFNCKEVGSWFKAKKSIKEITLGENVTSLGTKAFYACSGLTSITIPSNVTSIGDLALQGCSGLKSLTIPSTVTSFGFEPFDGCTGLTSITLDCKEVGNWFNRALPNVKELVLGENVTSVASQAFWGLNYLTSVTSLSTTPPTLHARIGETTMVVNFATLYVPVGCKDIYKQQQYWEEFNNIQEINATGINNAIRDDRNNGSVYNLNGSKQNEESIGKGIYIKNRKKVVIK